MKNRQLDATLISAGLGVSAIRDLATAVKIVIVPVPSDVIAKIGDPAYLAGTIPGNTYEGQPQAVPTVAIENFLVTHEGVPTDTVYKMTKAMYEHLDQLVAAHAAAKAIKREDGPKNMPIPLHPGAEKYYREVGLIK
jgi:TRAP transporter TAXI family solute receptor